jgi:RHS repeat-associated protein
LYAEEYDSNTRVRYNWFEYTASATANLFKPKFQITYDNNNTTLLEQYAYYDYSTTNGTLGSKGQLTRSSRGQYASSLYVDENYGYDNTTTGNLLTVTNPNNKTTTAAYHTSGHYLKSVTTPGTNAVPAGLVTQYGYYGIGDGICGVSGGQGLTGSLQCVKDPNGAETAYAYDALGRLTKAVQPGDSMAVPTTEVFYTDNYQYGTAPNNLRGLKVETRLREQAGCAGCYRPTFELYDGLGLLRQTRTEKENGTQVTVVTQGYDALGRTVSATVPYLENSPFGDYSTPAWANLPKTQTSYDGLSRVLQVTGPDGNSSYLRYGGTSTTRRVRSIDALNHTKVQVTDGLGRLVAVEEYTGSCAGPDNCGGAGTPNTTSYTYDVFDRLKTVTDAANNVTTIGYDALGRKTSMTDPDMGYWTYGYDAVGNLTSQTDAKNQTLTFSYDALNRLNTKHVNGVYVAWYGYDETNASLDGTVNHAKGQRTAAQVVANNVGTATWTRWHYDERGHPKIVRNATAETGALDTKYTYDSADRVLTMTYPDNEQVTTSYNAAGQPNSLQSNWGTTAANSTGLVNSATYNQLGQPKTWALGNGLTQQYQYHGLDSTDNFVLGAQTSNWGKLWRSRVIDTPNGQPYEFIQEMQYDNAGNVSRQSLYTYAKGWEAMQYTYDALDRLTSVAPYGGYAGDSGSYGYDAIGNMTNKTGIGSIGYNPSGANSVRPHAARYQNGVEYYAYDDNGNMTIRNDNGVGTFFQTWNADNKLASVSGPPGTMNLAYDADGQRVKSIRVGPAGYDAVTIQVGNHYEASNNTVWVDDGLPAGATPVNDTDGWNWVSDNPAPASGAQGHQSAALAGVHQHYFTNASQTLNVGAGDKLYAYVYLDPVNPPSSVMVQFYEAGTGWEHRAYWGANQFPWGTNGTASRYQACTCLPPVGQWVLLGVPASALGLEGKTVTGMAFSLVNGKATWDKAGKISPNMSNSTKYFYFGGQRVAMRKYSGSPTNTSVSWLHNDHLGSSSLATSGSGSVTAEQRYTPYGEVRAVGGGMPTNRGFNGNIFEFGLLDYGARSYSPILGRFISADSIVPGAGNPQAFNRYSYTFNNPLRYVDPSGHCPAPPKESGNVICVDLFIQTQYIKDANGNPVGYGNNRSYSANSDPKTGSKGFLYIYLDDNGKYTGKYQYVSESTVINPVTGEEYTFKDEEYEGKFEVS